MVKSSGHFVWMTGVVIGLCFLPEFRTQIVEENVAISNKTRLYLVHHARPQYVTATPLLPSSLPQSSQYATSSPQIIAPKHNYITSSPLNGRSVSQYFISSTVTDHIELPITTSNPLNSSSSPQYDNSNLMTRVSDPQYNSTPTNLSSSPKYNNTSDFPKSTLNPQYNTNTFTRNDAANIQYVTSNVTKSVSYPHYNTSSFMRSTPEEQYNASSYPKSTPRAWYDPSNTRGKPAGSYFEPVSHPCLRKCVEGEPSMTCRYRFELEWYHSLSKACYDCPTNITDCDRPHCILGDGFHRPLITVNRQIPGTPVEVCLGDRIIVDLVNHMGEESTTIHWHGHHQRGTPYMDGVPYITQCPIPPKSVFRYRYHADTPGTHFWHSHSGSQRADGAFGSLIVRVPIEQDPHKNLYDEDLPTHTIQILDWGHELGVVKFLEHHHAGGNNKPKTILVNGRGLLHDSSQNDNDNTPRSSSVAKFSVEKGYRYRFRLINAGFLNCPIQVSVDNHTILVISSDGSDLQPVEASSLVTYAGERFDFILNANQDVDNYWMRFRGLMDCDERFTSAHQVALLHYDGAGENDPESEVSYEAGRREGLTINELNVPFSDKNSLIMPELNALAKDDISLKAEADLTFYLSYDFYPLDNPTFNKAPLYGFYQVPYKNQRLYTPQFNHITMKMPTSPPLSQPNDFDPATTCNEDTVGNCTGRFCQCTHLLRVPLDAVVEIILIDKGETFDANHPFHLHGNAFRVVAMDRLGSTTTVEEVKELDRTGRLIRKLHNAPIKDTVTVPDGGYTVIRFHANNPGFWLFHCHIEFHVEVGMAVLLQVGEPKDFAPVPRNFPRCGNYLPSEEEEEIEVVELFNTVVTEVRDKPLLSLNSLPSSTSNCSLNPAPTIMLFMALFIILRL